jgi:hypothetical protein
MLNPEKIPTILILKNDKIRAKKQEQTIKEDIVIYFLLSLPFFHTNK